MGRWVTECVGFSRADTICFVYNIHLAGRSHIDYTPKASIQLSVPFNMSDNERVSLLLINGPNLNLLGTREPSVYGSQTLNDVHILAKQTASKHNVGVLTFQSNHEGAIIDRIHQAREEGVKGILINPGMS
jgi:hypothetical protein